MRSLAEERRARTDQLLLTSPVSVWGIVVGKYLALCTVFALPCLADGIMIVVLWLLGGTASACGANFAALLCYFRWAVRPSPSASSAPASRRTRSSRQSWAFRPCCWPI